MDLEVRKRFLKIYIWSIALYGCETWTISAIEKRKLEAFEVWCYRKMLRIKWIDRITNEAVLIRIKENKILWHTVKVRRAKMIGHLLRHESLTKTVIEGDVEGHIGRGRPGMEYMKQLMSDMGKNSYKKLKELSNDREAWRTAANQSKD